MYIHIYIIIIGYNLKLINQSLIKNYKNQCNKLSKVKGNN